MLGSIGAEEVCVIDVRKAQINEAQLASFREEVSRAVRYGLFPFAAPAGDQIGSSFQVTMPGVSDDKKRAAFSMRCEKQDEKGLGSKDLMDIRTGDAFRFSFYRKGSEGNFTHFSTNLSPKLFRALLRSCPETAGLLHKSLKDSAYFILPPEDTYEAVPELKAYLAGPQGDGNQAKILRLGIMKAAEHKISEKLFPESDKGGKKEENKKKIVAAAYKRSGKEINQEVFGTTLTNPVAPDTVHYVARCEIIPQLREAGLLQDLPKHPVIIDVGSGTGMNLSAIETARNDAIALGVDPLRMDLDGRSYTARIEEVPRLHKTADLVTVFNIQLEGNFDAFYRTLAELLVPGGQVVVGVHFNDCPTTRSGKRVRDHLDEHFGQVNMLPNPECYTQTLYVAREPRKVGKVTSKPADSFVVECETHMRTFIQKQEAVRVQIPEDVQNNLVLEGFLQKVKEKHPERGADPSLVLNSASSSKKSPDMAKAS